MAYVNIQDRGYPFFIRYLIDLMGYRHLCWNLVASDMRSRFRRTKLGVLWAIVQPLSYGLMIAFVWGQVFGATDYWEFALYVFSGMIAFECFSTVVVGGQDALMSAAGYLKQARIPFFIFQLRMPLTAMVIMLFGMLGLVVLLLALGRFPPPGLHLLLVPATLALMLLFLVPIAITMSILGAQFRDLKHISGILVQFLFFMSPVMLRANLMESPHLQFLRYVNPMWSMLDLFRAPLYFGEFWNMQSLAIFSSWIAGLWVIAFFVSARAGRRVVFAL